MVTCKLVERSCNFRSINFMFFINFGHISVRGKLPHYSQLLSKFLFVIEMQ